MSVLHGARYGFGTLAFAGLLGTFAGCDSSDGGSTQNLPEPDGMDCPAGSRADSADGECRPLVTCAKLDCGDRGRSCTEATDHIDAACGACTRGEESADGECALAGCSSLKCEDQHRTCSELPRAVCNEACVAGYMWDAKLEACRALKTCDELACSAEQTCEPETDTKDARCKGGSGGQCASGEGWDPTSEECRACNDGFSPKCDSEGETGAVLALHSTDDATCVCETEPGFYLGAQGGAAVACDADGDGWVSDSAQTSIESDNSVIRDNSRCNLRRIGKVLLQNEGFQTFVGEDFSAEFAEGLPLYESARNDGATSTSLPEYGGGALDARALNSFTKYCSVEDLNDNGVSDVSEWSGSPIALGASRPSKALAQYYARYTRLAYFAELHNAWYEPAVDSEPALYRVVERSRTGVDTQGVPLVYPAAAVAGVENDVKSCVRHGDAQFKWSSTFDGVSLLSPNTTGGDFAEFGNAGWDGMNHHSQFKCVQVTTEEKYGEQVLDDELAPEMVFVKNANLRRLGTNGTSYAVPWYANDCKLGSALGEAPGDGPNSAFPTVTCSTPPALPAEGSVLWAAVGFENAAQSSGYVSLTEPGNYVRGCRNECAELPEFTSLSGCDHCVVGPFGEGTKVSGSPNVGQSCGQCGGKVQCNGACSVSDPPNVGAGCGSCGGAVQCNGQCSVGTPGNYGQACGSCGGTVQCDGNCSVGTPGNYGQACGECGVGTYQCSGACSKSAPDWWGQSCGYCGGTLNNCNGTCSIATPSDYGVVSNHSTHPIKFSCCWIDSTITYGDACSPGYVFDSAIINKYSGGGSCDIVAEEGGSSCRVTVRHHNNGLEGANCELVIRQRRDCDPR
ncbi:MAG TPA: hypothetical protein VJN18_11550 [Polyangiaceae bacterium]|nr:hypothetical protein [Polyangiaceae bacterium]